MLSRKVPALVVTAFAALTAAWASLSAQSAQPPAAGQVDFTHDIQPILQSQCYECHGAKKTKNGLRLDRRTSALKGGDTGPAIEPGNSEHSLIVRRLLGLDGEDQMPKDKDPLAAAQIALIRRWIDQGAVWPDGADTAAAEDGDAKQPEHWAYRRPIRPAEPAVRNAAWIRTPVDRFVLARLDAEGLQPSAEAAFETLIRRVSLDLIGLPPTLQEVDEAVADAGQRGVDTAYETVVDRLLASPHYGERWARPWLDLARYADSHGFEKDLPRVMWKYRDWVIDALNRDMPFDQFTIEQIAGDMLPTPTTEQLIASGFHRNTMINEEGGSDPEEAMYEVLVDRVNTTATAWLGTTLGCAQCHDHKYDPFTQRDYYRMMAFFANNDYEVKTFGDGTRFFEPTIDVPTPQQDEQRKKIQAELDRMQERMKVSGPAFARGEAVWEHAMRLESSVSWRPLMPANVDASNGVMLAAGRDGSMIAGGANPGETVYTIDAPAALSRITAVRLEALPDRSLPRGGPGRDVYGNFQVNGLRIDVARPAGSTAPRKLGAFSSVNIRAIKADDRRAAVVISTRSFPRWRHGTARPLEVGASTPAGTRLDCPARSSSRWIGRSTRHWARCCGFVSATRDRASARRSAGSVSRSPPAKTPLRIVEIPAKLRPILDITVANRTKKQNEDLDTFYRSVATSLKLTRDRIAALQKDLLGARDSDRARHARAGGLRAAIGLRAAPRQLHRQTRACLCRGTGGAAASRRRSDAESPGSGTLAGSAGQSAHGQSRGQPCLGAVFWTRPRGDERRLRHAAARRRRIPSCSIGWLRTRPSEMAHEGAAQDDRHVGHLSADVDDHDGVGGARPVQPAAGARSAVQDGSRDGPRHGALGQRASEPDHRRPERISLPTRRDLGHSLQRRKMEAERGERIATAVVSTCSSVARRRIPVS